MLKVVMVVSLPVMYSVVVPVSVIGEFSTGVGVDVRQMWLVTTVTVSLLYVITGLQKL